MRYRAGGDPDAAGPGDGAGRMQSGNIINTPFSQQEIIEAVNDSLVKEKYTGKNNYYNQHSVNLIINHIKKFNEVV